MTMTDGEREIAKQLKRIADALNPPTEKSFADGPKRFAEPTDAQWESYARLAKGEIVYAKNDLPTESSNPVWERIMREGEGEHLLNPDADHTGEDVE